MKATSMIPCVLQRLTIAVQLNMSLKPLVIPDVGLGCSSYFQLWNFWSWPMWSDLVQGLSSRDSTPSLHAQEVLLLLFTWHLPSFCCVQSSPPWPKARFSGHLQGSWGLETPPSPGVSASKSRWCLGVKFSHCRVGEGYQVAQAGEDAGASLLLMWIKTPSSTPPITGILCDEVRQKALFKLSAWWDITLPVQGPCLKLWQWLFLGPSDLQLSTKRVPGCPLGRYVPGWFLWAPAIRTHPTEVSGNRGWWPRSQGALCCGAWGHGDLS